MMFKKRFKEHAKDNFDNIVQDPSYIKKQSSIKKPVSLHAKLIPVLSAFLAIVVVGGITTSALLASNKRNQINQPSNIDNPISEPNIITDNQFSLSIIDKGNYVFDKTEGKFASGSMIKMHANPIQNADLAMFVNGVYQCVQTSVESNGGNLWEYLFEIPNNDTTLEFKALNRNYEEIKTKYVTVNVNYTNPIEYLFNNAKIPFDIRNYGVDKIVAGDTAIIQYRGEWVETESIPSEIVSDSIVFVSLTVLHTMIYEYEYVPVPGGGTGICPVDSSVHTPGYPENVINEDGSFQLYDSYPLHTHFYGTALAKNMVSSQKDDIYKITALYSYDPLALGEREPLRDKIYFINELYNSGTFYSPVSVILGQYLGNVSPTFEMFNTFRYSENEVDIRLAMSFLYNTYVTRVNYSPREGIGKRTLTIVTPTRWSGPQDYDYYTITTCDGLLVINDEYYSLSIGGLPRLTYGQEYGKSFLSQALSGLMVIDTLDNDKDVTANFHLLNNISRMVFTEIKDNSVLSETNLYNRYKFQNELGYIVFEDYDVFALHTNSGKSGTYRIVNSDTYNFGTLRDPIEG